MATKMPGNLRTAEGGSEVSHCFEMRFHTPRPLPPWTDRLEEEFAAAAPFKQPLQLYRPHGMNTQESWLVVESCGYADQAEAEASGALLRDGLLIDAARQMVGLEFYLRGANPIYVYSGKIE